MEEEKRIFAQAKECTPFVWGIFGEKDNLAITTQDGIERNKHEWLFLSHYSLPFHFPGEHTPSYKETKAYHVPLVARLIMEFAYYRRKLQDGETEEDKKWRLGVEYTHEFSQFYINKMKLLAEVDGFYRCDIAGDAPYNSHTDATIYQCTSRKQAEEMLAQLISLIWQCTGEHKEVSYYEFQPFTRFTDWSTSVVIEFTSASKNKGAAPRDFHIVLYKAKGKELYYFAFLNTDGDLWLPLDWATVEHSKLTNKPMEGNITGTWKCSDQTLRNLGIDYDKMSGKIELKADSTFIMTAKGRGIGGHNFWSHRTVSVKLNGTYSIKGNSISFKLKRDDIKCHINDDVMDNDPKLDPTPAYKHQQGHTTWDAADRRHEIAKDHGSMQEESLKDDIHKAMPFRASITFIDSKTVQIGSTIYLTR